MSKKKKKFKDPWPYLMCHCGRCDRVMKTVDKDYGLDRAMWFEDGLKAFECSHCCIHVVFNKYLKVDTIYVI